MHDRITHKIQQYFQEECLADRTYATVLRPSVRLSVVCSVRIVAKTTRITEHEAKLSLG